MSDTQDNIPTHPAHPRNWGQLLILGLLWLLARLPWRAALKIGHVGGRLSYHLLSERRRIARRNIQLCFPELSGDEREAMVRRNFGYVGQGIAEAALAWYGGPAVDRIPCTVTGLEHLKAEQDKGRSVILLSGHFVSIELTGRLVHPHLEMAVIYKPLVKQPLLDRSMREARLRRGHPAVIAKDDIRGIVRTLRRGVPAWYAGDQNYRTKQKVFAPFFGIPTATVTALSRLSQMGRASVVPLFFNAKPDGSGYEIRLLPALADFPSGDLTEDAARMNAVLEQAVRQHPDQYLWIHRRFKDHPENLDMYPKVPDHREVRRTKKRRPKAAS